MEDEEPRKIPTLLDEILDKIKEGILLDIERSNPMSDEYDPDWKRR